MHSDFMIDSIKYETFLLFHNRVYFSQPHLWADNSDTEIMMARVNKQFNKTSKEQQESPEKVTSSQPTSALLPDHFIGLAYGGNRPHSVYEHIKNPNRSGRSF